MVVENLFGLVERLEISPPLTFCGIDTRWGIVEPVAKMQDGHII